MKVRSINVHLDIASLVNRGDWLMFEAMLEQVRIRRPTARIGVSERVYALNPDVYAKKGVVPVINAVRKSERLRKTVTKAGAFLFRRRRPLYVEEIDLVLFSPGFRFSDQFGVPSRNFIEDEFSWFASFSKKDRKFYFMPQAFGPFDSEINKARSQKLLSLASHIYSREQTSYTHIIPLVSNLSTVSISPDFTCLYHGEKYSLPFSDKDYVVIIPNRQMLVRSAKGVASKYCEFMFRLVRLLRSRGENVVLLNHEGVNDIGLIEILNASIDNSGLPICEVSGGVCKYVISQAKLVVTSRFHGLVSALAEGVPALCTSWSHKYQELVGEMGCPNACIELNSVDGAIHIVEDALASPEKYTSSTVARAAQERKVIAMWDVILPCDTNEQKSIGGTNAKLFYISPVQWNKFIWLVMLPFKLLRRLWR